MTITSPIKLFFVFLLVSCSVQKSTIKSDKNCIKINVEGDTNYARHNLLIIQNMKDFNFNSDKSLDIVRILNISGYESIESFKRIYIENNNVFIFENSILKKLSTSNSIINFYNDLKENSIMVNCNINSSNKYIYRYFIKKNGKLIFTFYSNALASEIDQSLISQEFKYIDFFEKLK